MVAIVVYSHVYGGWHAASPATCPTPHSQVHGTPCRRYGCPGRRRSPGPSRPYRYPAAASGAVPRNASDGESSGAVPDKWAVPASAWRTRRTVFLQCHVTQTRGTSLRVLGNDAFLQCVTIRCRKAVQKAVKRRIILGFI